MSNVLSFAIGAQFGGPAGFTQQQDAATTAGQHIILPDTVFLTHICGTFTVKDPGSEILLQIFSGIGDPLWFGEAFGRVTVPIDAPIPKSWGVNGLVYANWQALNNSGADLGTGGLFEYQLLFHCEIIGRAKLELTVSV